MTAERPIPFRSRPAMRTLTIALACAVLALSACGKQGDADAAGKQDEGKAGAAKGPDAVPVEAVAITRRSIAASYNGTAPLEARAEAQVVAKTSGVALQVMAEVGQTVSAGQALVRLDADRARLQAAQSAAQVRKLEANYNRSLQLSQQQLISANDLDQLRFDLENARAANRLANLEVSYASVVAPISGVIAERSIKPGNFVQINSPIFRIVDTARVEATLNVPERELAVLKAGQPVQLLVDAIPGRSFEGRVDRIAPVVDAGSGTFRVICAFDSDGNLQPGMFGRLRIDYDNRADASVIPRAALLDDQGVPAVFAVRGGKAVRVPVELGYMDGEWAELRGGLEPKDRVVTAGKIALRDGMEVQVIGDSKPAAAKPGDVKPAPKVAAAEGGAR